MGGSRVQAAARVATVVTGSMPVCAATKAKPPLES
jgi:hypothetical protein